MGPEITAWTGLRLLERVGEGSRNEVWRGELGGRAVSVRRSARPPNSLEWELDLIARLDNSGFRVARLVEADDGRRHVGGVVVQRWIDGRPPSSRADWAAVARTLQRIHQLPLDQTPQRPGCRIVTEFDRTTSSVDANLAGLPSSVADALLTAFAGVRDAPVGIVHGDPGPSNVRIDGAGRVGLLDFDESRIDVTWHDLSNLGVQVLDDERHRRALQLSDAWEAANGWTKEPAYARERLTRLLDAAGRRRG